jgi:hypothetical protein
VSSNSVPGASKCDQPGSNPVKILFWHDFLPSFTGNEIITQVTIKNLAYLALLAGWICFCYWLYAEGISPRLQRMRGGMTETVTDSLPYPLTFRWGSDIPMPGKGFTALKGGIDSLAERNEIAIVRGYYFRDEAPDLEAARDLGKRRVEKTLALFGINDRRILTEVLLREITADVKANPFEAIALERILVDDVVKWSSDTFELCFPLKDSIVLPAVCLEKLFTWMGVPGESNISRLHITGTADGSGIAEPSDMAMERAIYISQAAMDKGWKDEQINLSTGQRNHPLTLWNRCVVIYFE